MRVSTKSESECLTPPAGLKTAGMCVVNCGYYGNSYIFQHSEKSALFDRLCTPVRCPTTESFLCGRSSKTYILASLSGERCSGGQLLSTFSDLAGGLRDRIISSHFAGKLNSFNMALTPLPPPAILKCGGHILLNAYMHAMRLPSPTTPRWRCPWRWYAAPPRA